MSADERDVRAARMLLASLPDAPDSAVQAIAGHIAKLRDRAVDRVCEVHEQADERWWDVSMSDQDKQCFHDH